MSATPPPPRKPTVALLDLVFQPVNPQYYGELIGNE
jgi:hypothetical protein